VANVAVETYKFVTRSIFSLPACGGEMEREVSLEFGMRGLPPSLISRASFARLGPHKGGGHAAAFADRGFA